MNFKALKKISINILLGSPLIIMIGFFSNTSANYSNLVYDYSFDSLDGGKIELKDYKEKVIVVVNVASRCGYTPQYSDLQKRV